jgi:hypothetical protein
MLTQALSAVLALAGPEQSPIPSRWQHAAVPAWCPVPPTIVCEVSYTTLDLSVATVPEFVVSTPHMCH